MYERFPPSTTAARSTPSQTSATPDSIPRNSAPIPSWSVVGCPSGTYSIAAERSPYPSPASNDELETMRSTIRQLEDQLQKATQLAATQESKIESSLSGLSGEFHSLHHVSGPNQPRGASRSVWHKTRLFGQSHWVNGIVGVRDVFDLVEPYMRDKSDMIAKVLKTKSLGRLIKASYLPEWPTLPASDLPSRALADELVHNYFRTYESLHRVLHAPTFRQQYEAIWAPNVVRDEVFMVQLKLILAIGTGTHYTGPSLKVSAARWTCEGQTWLSNPKIKPRLREQLGIQYLQTHVLCLFAREVTGIGEDIAWTQTGSLYRLAMHLGLHRDPARLPKCTPYHAEMRRRLWNTIIEVNLRASINSGGSPLMTLDDFDTEPPGNFDDEELRQEEPRPKPEGEFTMMTVALALRHTFPLRLKITRFLNDIRSINAYEETLRLDAEYRIVYKELKQHLHECSSNPDNRPTDFQLHALQLIMSRYILALHIPGFSAALTDKTYAYSRTIAVETAYKLWSATVPTILITNARDDLAQLIATAAGFYRLVAAQASLILALDIRAQQQALESLGPSPLRRDFAHLLEEIKSWQLRTIEAGEPSCRGYVFICIVAAHIEGLAQGLSEAELGPFIVKAGEESMDRCVPILERTLAEMAPEGGGVDTDVLAFVTPGGLMDWDFLTSDAWFDVSGFEGGGEGGMYGPW